MRLRRRVATRSAAPLFALMVSFGATALATSCTDESDPNNPGSTADASSDRGPTTDGSSSSSSSSGSTNADSGNKDSATPNDSGSSDANNNADADDEEDASSNEDASDASSGPTITKSTAAAGSITVDEFTLFAVYYDSTILRVQGDTQCEAQIHPSGADPVGAGNILLTGGLIGGDGGPSPSPLTIAPDPNPIQYFFFDPAALLWDSAAGQGAFSLTTAGGTVPAITSAVTFNGPSNAMLSVTSPMTPDADTSPVGISPTTGLSIQWTPPAANTIDQVVVEFGGGVEADGGLRAIAIYCGFPAASGSATLPGALVKGVLDELGVSQITQDAYVVIGPGHQKSVQGTGGASTVIRTLRRDGSTFSPTAQWLAEIK